MNPIKRFFILLAILGPSLASNTASAQLFENTLGVLANHEESQDGKPIPNNRYILLSNTQSFGPANMIMLTRLNASGVIEMNITLHDQANATAGVFGAAIDLDLNAAGSHTGYFITGHRALSTGNQAILMRTDLNGQLSWLKILPGMSGHDERGVSVERQSNGDVTIVGNSKNPSSGVNTFVVARFNAVGAQLWSFRYATAGTGTPGTGFEAIEACNGFRAGTAVIAVTGKSNNHTFMSCINAANGTELWRRVYNSGQSSDQGLDIVYKAANGPASPERFMIVGSAGQIHFLMWVVRVDPAAGAGHSKIYAPAMNSSSFMATGVSLDATGDKAAIVGRLVAQVPPSEILNGAFAMVLPFFGTELPDWTIHYQGTNPPGASKESISRIPGAAGGYFITSGARLNGAATNDAHVIRINTTGSNGQQGCPIRSLQVSKTVTGNSTAAASSKLAASWTSSILVRTSRSLKQENCSGSLAGN